MSSFIETDEKNYLLKDKAEKNKLFCCISLVSESTTQRYPRRMINIRSQAYHNAMSANKFAKQLKTRYLGTSRDVDVYVIPLNVWIPWEDPVIHESKEQMKRLNTMMKDKYENHLNYEKEFELRKSEMMKSKETKSNTEHTPMTSSLGSITEETVEESKFDPSLCLQDDDVMKRQHYVVTFLTNIKDGMYGFKISGIYETEEDCDKRIEVIQKKTPHCNVYVGNLGCWQEWEPPISHCDDQKWGNPDVDEFMTGYFQHQNKVEEMRDTLS